MKTRTQILVSLLAVTTSACGGSEGAAQIAPTAVVPTPTPSSTPTPSPTPSPTPAPTPTPSGTSFANQDGVTVLVAEGDSISIDYRGYYTGAFKARHPEIQMHIQAVGGSTLDTLTKRQSEALALKPDVLTVFIGANDLGATDSADAYFVALMNYVKPFREQNVQVLVGTNLPCQIPTQASYCNQLESNRGRLAELLKAAVGKEIDGVFDFASDPTIGSYSAASNLQLYKDGLHPTDIGWNGATGGQDYLLPIYEKAVTPVLDKVRGQ